MADDEDAVAAACALVAILADSHNRKKPRNMDTTLARVAHFVSYAGFQRRIEHCAISR